jgi:cold shock CspA family protein
LQSWPLTDWVPTLPEAVQGLLLSLAGALLLATLRWLWQAALWFVKGGPFKQTSKIARLQQRLNIVRQVHESPATFIAQCVQGVVFLLALFVAYFVVEYVLRDVLSSLPVAFGPFRMTTGQLVLSLVLMAAFLMLLNAWLFVRPLVDYDRFERRIEDAISKLRAELPVSSQAASEAQILADEASVDRDFLEVDDGASQTAQAPPPVSRGPRATASEWSRGQIQRWPPEKNFGFISSENGETYYANVDSLIGTRIPGPRAVVYFRPSGETKSGASHERADAIIVVGEIVEGTIAEVLPERAFSVVRVIDANGKTSHLPMPFARSNAAVNLRQGQRVRFEVGVNRKGRPMAISAVPWDQETTLAA